MAAGHRASRCSQGTCRGPVFILRGGTSGRSQLAHAVLRHLGSVHMYGECVRTLEGHCNVFCLFFFQSAMYDDDEVVQSGGDSDLFLHLS